jgi:hypothetical protein
VLSVMEIAPFAGLAAARVCSPRAILNATLTGLEPVS